MTIAFANKKILISNMCAAISLSMLELVQDFNTLKLVVNNTTSQRQLHIYDYLNQRDKTNVKFAMIC